MAHFYSIVDSDRGMKSVTKTGHKFITGDVRGWKSGVKVSGFIDSQGNDVFVIEVTDGSANNGVLNQVATVKVSDVKGTHTLEITDVTRKRKIPVTKNYKSVYKRR